MVNRWGESLLSETLGEIVSGIYKGTRNLHAIISSARSLKDVYRARRIEKMDLSDRPCFNPVDTKFYNSKTEAVVSYVTTALELGTYIFLGGLAAFIIPAATNVIDGAFKGAVYETEDFLFPNMEIPC